MFIRWRNGIERKELKINLEKTKVMVTGKIASCWRRVEGIHVVAVDEDSELTQSFVAHATRGATRDALVLEGSPELEALYVLDATVRWITWRMKTTVWKWERADWRK